MRSRKPGENVSTYVAELRKFSEYCNFGDTLGDMPRDRLVCGINDPRIQRRPLAEPTLTYVKALDLAEAAETAESNAKQLEWALPCTAVQAISSEEKEGGARRQITSRRSTPTQNKCYRCGGKHNSDQCYFKDSTCYLCGKTGHIARVCRSKRGSKSKAPAEQDFKSSQQTHHVHSEGEEELYDEQLFNTPCKAPSPFMLTVQINQAKLRMEVDTGASASITGA